MESIYIIKRDGKPLGICEAPESVGPLAWFHRNCAGYSASHAVEHEGYSVDEGEPDCHDVEALLCGIAERFGLTMSAAFVPFSQSRNVGMESSTGEPWQSLNWKVTIQRNGRDVLTTDYGQGVAHCPADKVDWGNGNRHIKARAIALEIETGKRAKKSWGGDEPREGREAIPAPSIGDVLHSLALDSSVLDSAGFEDWAADLGYSTDSRKAESIWKLCLDHALKLQAAIGGEGLAELRLAARFN